MIIKICIHNKSRYNKKILTPKQQTDYKVICPVLHEDLLKARVKFTYLRLCFRRVLDDHLLVVEASLQQQRETEKHLSASAPRLEFCFWCPVHRLLSRLRVEVKTMHIYIIYQLVTFFVSFCSIKRINDYRWTRTVGSQRTNLCLL